MRRSWVSHRWGIRGSVAGWLHRHSVGFSQRMKRQQDENFLQLFEIGGGPDAYLLELITGLNFCNRSDGQVARKDAVHAARNDSLPHIHVVVVGDVFHGEHGLTHSTDGVLDPGIGEFGAYAAFLVSEQEHLGRIGIGFDDFSNYAVRRDDSHVFADAIMLAAIELNRQAARARTASDDARSDHGHIRLRLPKVKQRSKAVGFGGFSSSWATRSFSASFSLCKSSLSLFVF